MAYDLQHRLVLGVASSALFDLTESDAVFRREGEEPYRRYQEEHVDDQLAPGVAFGFVRRLLSLNDLGPPDDPPVEVMVLSRNDPDTGRRVMRSIASHGLGISRAIFMQGRAPYRFMKALNMSLFLSADAVNVREAVQQGYPAGQVLLSAVSDDTADGDLRIAFDFDGVLADDAAERIYQTDGIQRFRDHEAEHATEPHGPGPLRDFLAGVNRIQQLEQQRQLADPGYRIRVHVSIVTARDAPSHDRAIASLKAWGVTVNDAFFLGGIDKARIIEVLQPHIFFEDQQRHLLGASRFAPSVHIPFGVANETPTDLEGPAAS